MWAARNAFLTAGLAGPEGDLFWDYTSLLLTAGDGTGSTNSTFLDSSANNFTVTRAGDVTQGLVSPVSGGGSAYFDGSGDYLSIPDNAALDLPGDFTVEFWIKPESGVGSNAGIVAHRNQGGWTNGTDWTIRTQTDVSKVGFGYDQSGAYWDMGSYTLGQWSHHAISRSGTTIRTFRNGQLVTTVTNNSFTFSTAHAVLVGLNFNIHFKGSISDVRIVKGTALYTSNFTVPTAPLTAVSGTSLLLNMNNASIVDRTGKNTLAVFGDAQASAAQTKFASRSIYFDGSGDWVTVPDSTDLRPGTGSFTWEFWWYPTALTGYRTPLTKGYAGAGDLALQTGNGDGKLNVVISGSVVVASTIAVTVNTWNHVAVVRDSTTLTIYINGTSGGTASNSSNINSTSAVGVGDASGGSLYPSAGYMEDVRITKGVARYTANFDPPTKAFPVVPSPLIKRYRTNTYYQSSIYNPSQNTFATWANMNDLDCNTGTATASANPSWVSTDLGATKSVGSVTIGYDRNNSIPGGWGVNYSVSGGNVGVAKLQSSNNNVNWTDVVNLPSYFSAGSPSDGLHTVNVSLSCRYLRIVGSEYFALTQFGVFSP